MTNKTCDWSRKYCIVGPLFYWAGTMSRLSLSCEVIWRRRRRKGWQRKCSTKLSIKFMVWERNRFFSSPQVQSFLCPTTTKSHTDGVLTFRQNIVQTTKNVYHAYIALWTWCIATGPICVLFHNELKRYLWPIYSSISSFRCIAPGFVFECISCSCWSHGSTCM